MKMINFESFEQMHQSVLSEKHPNFTVLLLYFSGTAIFVMGIAQEQFITTSVGVLFMCIGLIESVKVKYLIELIREVACLKNEIHELKTNSSKV